MVCSILYEKGHNNHSVSRMSMVTCWKRSPFLLFSSAIYFKVFVYKNQVTLYCISVPGFWQEKNTIVENIDKIGERVVKVIHFYCHSFFYWFWQAIAMINAKQTCNAFIIFSCLLHMKWWSKGKAFWLSKCFSG